MSARAWTIRIGQYTAGFAAFVLLWWGGSRLAGPSVLPTPAAVAAYLATGGVALEFLRQVSLTAGRALLGFWLAWVVAVPAGMLMGRRRPGERIGFFPLFLLQSAPPILWVTPLVLWLGTRGPVAPATAFLVSLPLLTVHTLNAVKHIPAYEYHVFAVYAPRPLVIARELYLPHLIPALKSNIHLGFLVAVKASMLAEWFASQDGFGQTIRVHYQFFAMTEFVGWALLFLVTVGAASLGIKALLDRTLPARRPTQTSGLPAGGLRSAGAPPLAAAGGRAALTVRNLSFGYDRRPLFERVSFSVDTATPMVLHGRSGCGKTSLLNCLAGLRTPWSGSVEATGRSALVFQQDALLDHRDALGNVLLPAMPRYTAADVERARDCLELWGLADAADRFPHELSGGMCKRLAMARAWFLEPSILLLDEPFVNLDREARLALWELFFARLAESNVAALIVTHYPEEIASHPAIVRSWDELTAARGSDAALVGG